MVKPCPFCGYQPHYKTETDPLPPHAQKRVWIKCVQCRQAQVCSDWYGGDLGTTEACWNKRFDEPNKHSSPAIMGGDGGTENMDQTKWHGGVGGGFVSNVKDSRLCEHGVAIGMNCSECYKPPTIS